MMFKDSHNEWQPIIGYGWEKGWYLDSSRDFRLGLGVTAGITARVIWKGRMSAKRDSIITTAMRLFNQYGFTNIGIDRIIDESGVAKMTFYKHFHLKIN